jgi:protein phosphatase
LSFECAVSATRGARAYQEDAAVFWPGPATFAHGLALPEPAPDAIVAILADGMGGHAGGATASEIACRTFLAGLARIDDLTPFLRTVTESTVPLKADNAEDAVPGTRETTLTRPPRQAGPPRDELTAALHAANAALDRRVALEPALAGMGTTLVAALLTPAALEWISVGDSPLYLCRAGEIALLNEDHSLAPALDQLVREGRISAEAARNDPRRHMLRSALTGEEIDLVDRSRRPLQLEPGDVVVLASDGIQSLREEEIARLVTAYRDDGADAVSAALIRAIEDLRIRHQDNATVMVIHNPG